MLAREFPARAGALEGRSCEINFGLIGRGAAALTLTPKCAFAPAEQNPFPGARERQAGLLRRGIRRE